MKLKRSLHKLIMSNLFKYYQTKDFEAFPNRKITTLLISAVATKKDG